MFKMFKKRYSKGYSVYPEVGKVTDEEVFKYVKEHMYWWDKLDYHKVCDATIEAYCMLTGCIMKDMPKH